MSGPFELTKPVSRSHFSRGVVDRGLGVEAETTARPTQPEGKPLPRLTEQQSENLHHLHSLLDELEKRLEPVTEPELTACEAAMPSEPGRPGVCDLLSRHNSRLVSANNRLRSLIERLQF